MQVTETQNEGLKRGYAITVTAAELEKKVNSKLEEARKDFQMKGFRKGKAPLPLLKKMFGKSILGEVVQESVDGAIRKHFEDTGDRPAAQPDVKITNEDFDEGDDLQLELAYDKLPEVPEPIAIHQARSFAANTTANVVTARWPARETRRRHHRNHP